MRKFAARILQANVCKFEKEALALETQGLTLQ